MGILRAAQLLGIRYRPRKRAHALAISGVMSAPEAPSFIASAERFALSCAAGAYVPEPTRHAVRRR
jgi:hypothetical protein